MSIPTWAIYTFITCFVLLIIIMILDWWITRRKSLNQSWASRKNEDGTILPYHHKRSTNMVLQM
uniref:Secreted protein n=1 Tax=Rhabditophanes sp. KR3021 TaxID=114890 RepID=A0AC35U7G4_9BILA